MPGKHVEVRVKDILSNAEAAAHVWRLGREMIYKYGAEYDLSSWVHLIVAWAKVRIGWWRR